MKTWKMAAVAGSLMVAMVAAGCGGKPATSGADGNEIKLGSNFELTGGVAQYGSSANNGIKLAIKEINAKGGLLGKQVKLVVADNKSEPAEAANATTKLITEDKVAAILGPAASAGVLASLPIVAENKVPLLTPTGTNPKVTVENGKVNEFAFRACFIDPFQGKVMGIFAAKSLHAKTAAIYVDNSSDYSKGLAKNFEQIFKENGGTIVAQEAFLQKDQDFKPALTKLKAANPDVLYIPAYYEEVGKIVKQARELGIDCALLGSDGWDSPKLTEIAGVTALNHTYFTNHYSSQDTSEKVKQFVAAYKAEYGQEPDAFAVLGYDGAMLVMDAIQRAGSADRVKIKEGLAQTKDFQGVTGNISIDANHDPVKSAVIIEMKEGKQTFKERINP